MERSYSTSRNDRLRQARIERNWRQHELAEHLGTTVVTVRRWERGYQQPSPYFHVKLCALFGKSAVEHTLAHVGQWQGRRARYRGSRKNLFDLRRCAVVHNLHVLARSQLLSVGCQDVA